MSETLEYIIINKDNNKEYKFPSIISNDIERINTDDNILTIINKIINYCYDKTNKKKIEYSSIYAYYINEKDNKTYPLSFIYESNTEINYELNDISDDIFINDGNRVDIPLNNKLSKILYDIKDIKDNKIYFNSLPEFLLKYKSFNDIFYYSVIKKYWPFINFNPKTYEAYIKNISLEKNIKRIKNVTDILDINNKQITIVKESQKIIDIKSIFTYDNIKLSTKIEKQDYISININKLFADIELNDIDTKVIFTKLVLNDYKESFYKIYKPFIDNKKITEKLCDTWIQGNTLFIYGRIVREQLENVLILKIYVNDKFYISLEIWKEGIVELNIDNKDNIIDNKDINDAINLSNKLLKIYKNSKIYGDIPIFDKITPNDNNIIDVDNTNINKNNQWNKYIKNINCKLTYSKYDNNIIDTREKTKGNTNIDIKKLKNLLNNFSAYCRVIDDVDNPNSILIRYKRVNNYVKVDNIENQIIILYNQIQKGTYNPDINEVKKIIIKKIQQDFELNKEDAIEKVNITFMEIDRNESFRVDKNGIKIYTESDIDPGAEIIFNENDNKILININNIKSIYEINNIILFIEFIVNFYTLYITDVINPEYKELLDKIEPWVKKSEKYEEVAQIKEINTVIREEDIPVNDDDDDSDDDSSIDSIGGNGMGEFIIQNGGEGYILKRLKSRDPSLFKWKAKDYPDIEPWVKRCQPVDRHPIVVDDKELEHIINSENLGSGRKSYGNAESLGSDPNNKLNYICPKYWDVGKNISLDPNKMIPKTEDGSRPEIKDGEWYQGDIVPAKEAKSTLKKGIIQRDSIFWNDAKDVSDFYVEDTIKRIPPWQNPFGHSMPCCFNIKNIDIAKKENKIDEVNNILLEFLGENPSNYFLSKKIKKDNHDYKKILIIVKDLIIELSMDNITKIYNKIIDINSKLNLKDINKLIKDYKEININNGELIKMTNKIKNTENKKLCNNIVKNTKIQIKYLENEINRLNQGQNEINLYNDFDPNNAKKYIKTGLISGFYKVRLEKNTIMDCFLRISKYMQNVNNLKDQLETKEYDELILISENYEIKEQVDIIDKEENELDKKKLLIDLLISVMDEPEISETVKSKTRKDITNVKNLNTLFDSEIIFDKKDIDDLSKKISNYYILNKQQLPNILIDPSKDFIKIIEKNIKDGLINNLKDLDLNQFIIKTELEENYLEKIIKNYMSNKSIDDVSDKDLNNFYSLLDKPKIWDVDKLGNKKYWGSEYGKIDELLKKYTDLLDLSKDNKYIECNNLFNDLFNESKLLNRKISSLINSYIYDLYMNGYKKYFIEKIRENPLNFLKASNGNIINSFSKFNDIVEEKDYLLENRINKAIDNYEKYIKNEINHNDLFIIPVIKTILPEFFETNIIILDSNTSGENIKVPFNYFSDYDKNKKFVMIVKTGNIYEPLFYRYIEDEMPSDSNIIRKKILTDKYIIENSIIEKRQAILNINTNNKFLKNSLNIIKDELKEIFNMNNSIPKNILTYDKLNIILKKENIKIKKYFINSNNKISHIILENNIIIPIYPIGLVDYINDKKLIESDIIYDYKLLPKIDIKEIEKFFNKLNEMTGNLYNYKSDNDKINIIIDTDNGDTAVNILFDNNSYIPIDIKLNKLPNHETVGYINLFELDFNLSTNFTTNKNEYVNTCKLFEYENKVYNIFRDTILIYLLKNTSDKPILKQLIKEYSENINEYEKIQLINSKIYLIIEKIIDNLFKFTDDTNIDDIFNIKCNELISNCKQNKNCIDEDSKCLYKIKKTSFNSKNSLNKDKFIYKFIQSIIKYDYPELVKNINSYINIPISDFKNTVNKNEIYYDYIMYSENKLNLLFDETHKYYKFLNLYGDNLPE